MQSTLDHETDQEVFLDVDFDDELVCVADGNPAHFLFIHGETKHPQCIPCKKVSDENIAWLREQMSVLGYCTTCEAYVDIDHVKFIPI